MAGIWILSPEGSQICICAHRPSIKLLVIEGPSGNVKLSIETVSPAFIRLQPKLSDMQSNESVPCQRVTCDVLRGLMLSSGFGSAIRISKPSRIRGTPARSVYSATEF